MKQHHFSYNYNPIKTATHSCMLPHNSIPLTIIMTAPIVSCQREIPELIFENKNKLEAGLLM